MEYTVETATNGNPVNRVNFSGRKVNIIKGLCRADPDNPYSDRSIGWYGKNVLKPGIEEGRISDGSKGPFDDRKMRLHGVEFAERPNPIAPTHPISEVDILLGHSYYGEPGFTPESGDKLTRLGEEHLNDPYAFFPRVPGVTGLIKAGRKIFIGDRMENKAMAGHLQGAAGFLTYQQNLSEVSLEGEMYKELLEETGIRQDQVTGLEFLALVSDPNVNGDDLDFTYLITTDLDPAYLSNGEWKNNVQKKERDHNDFHAIEDFESLQRLIKTGELNGKQWSVVFSTQGPLEQLTEKDFE